MDWLCWWLWMGLFWAGYSGWHCVLRTATAAGSNISHKQWHRSELGRHGACVGPYLLWCSESKFGWSAPFQWIVEYPCTFSDSYWMVVYCKAVVIDLYAGKFLCILTPKAAAPAEVIHSEFLHHWLWLKRYQDFIGTNLPGLYVVHKYSLRGNRLKARVLLRVNNHKLFMWRSAFSVVNVAGWSTWVQDSAHRSTLKSN